MTSAWEPSTVPVPPDRPAPPESTWDPSVTVPRVPGEPPAPSLNGADQWEYLDPNANPSLYATQPTQAVPSAQPSAAWVPNGSAPQAPHTPPPNGVDPWTQADPTAGHGAYPAQPTQQVAPPTAWDPNIGTLQAAWVPNGQHAPLAESPPVPPAGADRLVFVDPSAYSNPYTEQPVYTSGPRPSPPRYRASRHRHQDPSTPPIWLRRTHWGRPLERFGPAVYSPGRCVRHCCRCDGSTGIGPPPVAGYPDTPPPGYGASTQPGYEATAPAPYGATPAPGYAPHRPNRPTRFVVQLSTRRGRAQDQGASLLEDLAGPDRRGAGGRFGCGSTATPELLRATRRVWIGRQWLQAATRRRLATTAPARAAAGAGSTATTAAGSTADHR